MLVVVFLDEVWSGMWLFFVVNVIKYSNVLDDLFVGGSIYVCSFISGVVCFCFVGVVFGFDCCWCDLYFNGWGFEVVYCFVDISVCYCVWVGILD